MSLETYIAGNCPHGCLFDVRVPDDIISEEAFTKYSRECPIFEDDIQIGVTYKEGWTYLFAVKQGRKMQ